MITTAANDTMKLVHDRMPLVLEKNEIVQWLNEEQLTENFLQKTPALLERKVEYEQMNLFSDLSKE